jgi:hypothetical protein
MARARTSCTVRSLRVLGIIRWNVVKKIIRRSHPELVERSETSIRREFKLVAIPKRLIGLDASGIDYANRNNGEPAGAERFARRKRPDEPDPGHAGGGSCCARQLWHCRAVRESPPRLIRHDWRSPYDSALEPDRRPREETRRKTRSRPNRKSSATSPSRSRIRGRSTSKSRPGVRVAMREITQAPTRDFQGRSRRIRPCGSTTPPAPTPIRRRRSTSAQA